MTLVLLTSTQNCQRDPPSNKSTWEKAIKSVLNSYYFLLEFKKIEPGFVKSGLIFFFVYFIIPQIVNIQMQRSTILPALFQLWFCLLDPIVCLMFIYIGEYVIIKFYSINYISEVGLLINHWARNRCSFFSLMDLIVPSLHICFNSSN